MRSFGNRVLGLVLSGILIVSLPMGVEASDTETSETSQKQTELSEPQTSEEALHVIDMEEEGYYIRLHEDSFVFEGQAVEPEFEICRENDKGEEEVLTLQKDIDYSVRFENNLQPSDQNANGSPVIIVEGIEKNGAGYCGTLKKEFEITGISEKEESVDASIRPQSTEPAVAAVSLGAGSVSLSATSYNYDGKAKVPAVTVKYGGTVLKNGTDYTLQYKNNIRIGTASVTVRGCGKYTGTKTVNYVIKLGTSKLSSASSYSLIKVKWGKVSGAYGYQIYRSTSKTSGFRKIKTITSGSTSTYSDKSKSLKLGRTYYYKVRAYAKSGGKTVYGSFTPVKAQKKQVSTPKITGVKKSYTSVKISWKKVGGASGYRIYRSSSPNGKYKKIATIRKSSAKSYTNSKLSSGKTYYYKVKAYRKSGKKTYFGAASSAQKATTKKLAGNWRYVNGYKLFYDNKGKLVKDVSSIIGKQSSYVIKVNKKKNCVTVYAKDGKRGYIIPVKAFVCSAGKATPITTARTPAKYRWRALMGNCYGQWSTRIKSGYLFHSVMYGRTKNTSLSVSAYNKLGTTASHGCIRLRAGDAKWIYDNCKLKTKVIIYNSSNPGPLGKPKAVKLPKWHTWDPTDPTAQYKCRQRGCH